MKNIIKIGLTLCAGVVLSSCIQETFPTSVTTSGQTDGNPKAMESMVGGMAAFVNKFDVLGRGDDDMLHTDYGYPSMGMIRDMLCDNVAAVSSGYEQYHWWIINKYQGDSYAYSQLIWNFYTQWVNSANSVIGTIDHESDDPVAQAYLAMGYCYRALAYLDMGRMYEFKPNKYTSGANVEGLTVPIVREGITEAEARQNPRVPKEELVAFIEEDLLTAIDLFEASGMERSSMAEPDLSVAYGLLARLYLWNEQYSEAKKAAENALAAGDYSPLTEAQWTDTATGFNSASSQKSWMWASLLVKEDDVVKSGIINFTSFMSSETSFGYACYGPFRLAAVNFYNQIPDTDFRKKSWKAPAGSSLNVPYVAATSDYPGPSSIPDLGAVKFRPGSGNPDDYQVGAVADYPMMRMEEMEFIIAEADARAGNSLTLQTLVKTRNPSYTVSAIGDALIEEVFFQKSVEFWGEGIIFFDYKRLNHSITRGYEGTNHSEDARFNTDGLAPWMNFCIVQTEGNANAAFVNNPDPSDTVELWVSAF